MKSLIDVAIIGTCIGACLFANIGPRAEIEGGVKMVIACAWGVLFSGIVVVPHSYLSGDRRLTLGRGLWFAYPLLWLSGWGAAELWVLFLNAAGSFGILNFFILVFFSCAAALCASGAILYRLLTWKWVGGWRELVGLMAVIVVTVLLIADILIHPIDL